MCIETLTGVLLHYANVLQDKFNILYHPSSSAPSLLRGHRHRCIMNQWQTPSDEPVCELQRRKPLEFYSPGERGSSHTFRTPDGRLGFPSADTEVAPGCPQVQHLPAAAGALWEVGSTHSVHMWVRLDWMSS